MGCASGGWCGVWSVISRSGGFERRFITGTGEMRSMNRRNIAGRQQVRPCNAQGRAIELQLSLSPMETPGCEDRVGVSVQICEYHNPLILVY